MKRRALLSAVAVGGLAGCLDTQPDPEILGVNGSVDTAVCGDVVARPCSTFPSVEFDTDIPRQLSSRRGGHTGVRWLDEQLRIEGNILGTGDADCRMVRVSLVELQAGTLHVVVRNDWNQSPLVRGCTEDAAFVHYAVTVDETDVDRVERVKIRHYDSDGSLALSGSIYLRGSPHRRDRSDVSTATADPSPIRGVQGE